MMDENLLTLLEELSLRTSLSEDDRQDRGNKYLSSGYTSQASNVSSPSYDQLESGPTEEDIDLKNAVSSLFQELNTPNQNGVGVTHANSTAPAAQSSSPGYDKTKLLVALLGNIDLVKCAIMRINKLVSLGKKMEHIYRMYYVDPNVSLDLEEMGSLIAAFSDLYNSESYVREVNVSRVYQAYCKKLIDIYNTRMSEHQQQPAEMQMGEEEMIT